MKQMFTWVKTLLFVTLTTLLIPLNAQNCDNPDVLILNDDGSEDQVIAFLNDAGITNITDCCIYYNWDGIAPNANDYDVVIYLDGVDYGYGFDDYPQAADALVDFVNGGGTLIVTEWLAYDIEGDPDNFSPEFIGMMPFINPNGDYTYGTDRNVLLPCHPLADNLSLFIPEETAFGHAHATPHPQSVVVINSSTNYPMLYYRDIGDGKVIHVNHDMTYNDDIDDATGQMLVNAVRFGACPPDAVEPVIGDDASCDITDITAGAQHSCDEGTGTYTQEIWVDYEMEDLCTNFLIELNGQGPWIKVPATGVGPQKISLELPLDGRTYSIFIKTDDFGGCTYYARDLFTAPRHCGCDVTDMTIASEPRCTDVGKYKVCFKLHNWIGPEDYSDMKTVIDGREYPISTMYGVDGGTVICVTDLPSNGQMNDVFMQLEGGCTITKRDMYRAPDRCDGPDCLPPPANLIHWWPGDGHANDIVGGVPTTAEPGVTYAPGMVGQAFQFDGGNDSGVRIAEDDISAPQGSFTIDMWVKYTAENWAARWNVILEFEDDDFWFGVRREGGPGNTDGEGQLVMYDILYSDDDGGVIMPKNEWVFVAYTWDGSTSSLYMNNQLVATTSSGPDVGGDGMGIGYNGSDEEWIGLIDEVEIFDRALSAAELFEIWEAGELGKCKDEMPGDDDDDDDDDDEECDLDGLSVYGYECNGDGTYDICFEIDGVGLPATADDAKLVIDHNTTPIAHYGYYEGRWIVCAYNVRGNYTNGVEVFFRAENGCSTTARELYDEPDCNNRREGRDQGFNIYPNPTTGSVNITSREELSSRVIVINSIGQIVHKGELPALSEKQIDLSRFDSGLYIIRIENEKETITKKITLMK